MAPFRVWAPRAQQVDLVLGDRRLPMDERPDGWFAVEAGATHGSHYGFSLDSGPVRPDPRGPWLPDGVHAPGRWYDHTAFSWSDTAWRGRDWSDSVLYEVHVGTFTAEGTFDAAVDHLSHLVELGVTHVELMPVCAFDGDAGWGYDGVAVWSVHQPYGGPDGLKRFIDAAHGAGLGVILDVVHNHLGPSGNYLSEFAPFTTDRVRTPWGEAVNLDGPGSDGVRAYFIDSVRAWLKDFHADGVRLDAVHELHDTRAVTLLEELGTTVHQMADERGRPLVIVAESDRNDPATVQPVARGGLGMTAQWDDDVHHALHAWLTGEAQGYYADFAADPAAALGAAYSGGFFHAGTYSSFRGRVHGRGLAGTGVTGANLVASLQTHDQVGNRAHGERLSHLVPTSHQAAGAALLLLGPFVPMLFMGEEWAASTPWLFFSSFPDPTLAASVTHGRRAEFADHGWMGAAPPDPQAPATVERSVLDWSERMGAPHAAMLAWYRQLIALRHEHAELRDPELRAGALVVDGPLALMRRGQFTVVASLAESSTSVPVPGAADVVAACTWGGGAAWVDRRGGAPTVKLPRESVAVVR